MRGCSCRAGEMLRMSRSMNEQRGSRDCSERNDENDESETRTATTSKVRTLSEQRCETEPLTVSS